MCPRSAESEVFCWKCGGGEQRIDSRDSCTHEQFQFVVQALTVADRSWSERGGIRICAGENGNPSGIESANTVTCVGVRRPLGNVRSRFGGDTCSDEFVHDAFHHAKRGDRHLAVLQHLAHHFFV